MDQEQAQTPGQRGTSMNVFISWSGDRSRRVAASIAEWLPNVLQATKPWTSESIAKGDRWAPAVAEKLNESPVGIICVTPENKDARWLLFEAGAIARTPDAKVCTYLLSLAKTDIEDPLAQFQATEAEEGDTWRLIRSVNDALGEKRVDDAIARKAFDAFWPSLAEGLKVIAAEQPEAGKAAKDAKRTEREMLQEILERQRRVEQADRWQLKGALAPPPPVMEAYGVHARGTGPSAVPLLCSNCSATGKLTTDGLVYSCPECDGKGTTTKPFFGSLPDP